MSFSSTITDFNDDNSEDLAHIDDDFGLVSRAKVEHKRMNSSKMSGKGM